MSLLGMDLPVPLPVLALAVLVSGLAAAMQGTIGFGYAVVAVPILSLLDPRLAPVPQILTTLPLTALVAWRERGHIDAPGFTRLMVGRMTGFTIGAILVAVASRTALDVIVGASVLVGVACLGSAVVIPRTRAVDLGVGTVSGIAGYVSGIGGPPLALLYRNASGPIIRSTLGLLFAAGVTITVVVRTVLGQVAWLDVQVALVLLPAVLLGMWVSRFFHGVMEGRGLRLGILGVSVIAAIGVVLRAVSG